MKKIIFILTMALCSLFVNAQQLEPNYHYSFWSNWNMGVGAVYSKPFDVNNWWFDNGANFGADLRFAKPLSNTWTFRLNGYVPGFIDNGSDRYGNIVAGFNLNFCPYVYLFADGGISLMRTMEKQTDTLYSAVTLACDYGIGSHIPITDNAKIYIEIGSDCSQYFDKEMNNSKLFAKVGLLCNLGVTKKDKENIAKLHENENNIPKSEYERVLKEKELCNQTLDSTIRELNNMRNCCQNNNAQYEKQIKELKAALADKKDTSIPFSVLFDKNSVTLSNTAKEIISQVAIEMLNDGGNYTLYGFGDYTGTEDYNQVLSASRCESVKAELVRKGVSEDKISVVGLGKTQYFGTAESYVNRRVMFVKN